MLTDPDPVVQHDKSPNGGVVCRSSACDGDLESDMASSSSSSSASTSSFNQMVSKSRQLNLSDNPSTSNQEITEEADIKEKFDFDKHFDIAEYSTDPESASDHYYDKPESHGAFNKVTKLLSKLIPGAQKQHKPSKEWVTNIQKEWKILESGLPESIYVRVYEERMDLMRAVIIGPSGTPYHDGLFFFDFHFPPNYPNVPPAVHYHSHGYRLNPNLYANGYVCLSLLGTWMALRSCEKWKAGKSTVLQVLVSIQGLVLNKYPFYNEPYMHQQDCKHSVAYNETAFLLSCHTMLAILQNPPKNFEDFVIQYFRKRGQTILDACKAYMNDVVVSFFVEAKGKCRCDICKNSPNSPEFKSHLKILYTRLSKKFQAIGN